MPRRPSKPPAARPESPDALRRDLQRMLSRQDFANIDEVNAFMAQIVGKPLDADAPANDRERAEDLVMAARGERSAATRRRMISDALALDTDCLPAHVALSEEAASPSEALTHINNAVAAGERVLAPLLSEADAFVWGDPVGRIWLIACAQQAELHWQRGDRPRAIAGLREVLRRNPNDNQGMRYVLLQWLMRAGSLADIDQLLASYDEGTTAWAFPKALHLYRMEGATAAAAKALRAAIAENRFVVPMLIGTHPMPDHLPDSYTLGGEDEAAMYVESALTLWIDAIGSFDWAVSVAPRSNPAAKRPRKR